MGRHRAPDAVPGEASVVEMETARLSRYRTGTSDGSRVGTSVAVAMVDDLTLITADDHFLDRIAAGQGEVFADSPVFARSGPGTLAPLLATWRADIVDPHWPDLPTIDDAVTAAARPQPKRARRALQPIVAVAVAISALLFGSAAVGAQHAVPGDTLWPLAQVLYADHASSVKAGIAAQASLSDARAALILGQPGSAIVALTSASVEVQKVLTTDGKNALQQDLDQLWNEATSSLQAATPGAAPVVASSTDRYLPAVTAGTPTKPGQSTSGPGSSSTSTGSGATTSVGPTSPTATSPGAGTTAPTHTADPTGTHPVTPPPVGPTTTVITTAPTSPDPSTSSAPTTADPVTTTAPTSTDPGTPTTSDAPTTGSSTTSELPTPTQTPGAQTGAGAGAQGLAVDGSTTSDQ